ncbi:MAG: hypothetical protein ACLQU1_28145 [Bryobacteraceae bacterium]
MEEVLADFDVTMDDFHKTISTCGNRPMAETPLSEDPAQLMPQRIIYR